MIGERIAEILAQVEKRHLGAILVVVIMAIPLALMLAGNLLPLNGFDVLPLILNGLFLLVLLLGVPFACRAIMGARLFDRIIVELAELTLETRDRLLSWRPAGRKQKKKARGRRAPVWRGPTGDVKLAAISIDVGLLVSALLHGALLRLPLEVRDRWAEEWSDHGSQQRGWRLVWWAMCLRLAAGRMGRECRRARLPLNGN